MLKIYLKNVMIGRLLMIQEKAWLQKVLKENQDIFT